MTSVIFGPEIESSKNIQSSSLGVLAVRAVDRGVGEARRIGSKEGYLDGVACARAGIRCGRVLAIGDVCLWVEEDPVGRAGAVVVGGW